METVLLAAGAALIAAGGILLLLAAVFFAGYRSLRDGEPEHYRRLRRKTAVFSALGIVLTAGGAVCLII